MNEETIIRKEAFEFFENKLIYSSKSEVIDRFQDLKFRLLDFYTDEYKAIFLDEIQTSLVTHLTEHRNESHKGERGNPCTYEDEAELIQFYIKQEQDILPKITHQRFQPDTSKVRSKVFVSYSHFDKDILVDMQRHFKPFLNQIDFWDDSKIEPGQKWKEEIRNAIDEAKVAILLVSTDFLGSEFISSHELPPLLESAEKNGTTILTVILKPCLFEMFDALNEFQAMNNPSRPISKMDENEREDLYVNLVRQTLKSLKEIKE